MCTLIFIQAHYIAGRMRLPPGLLHVQPALPSVCVTVSECVLRNAYLLFESPNCGGFSCFGQTCLHVWCRIVFSSIQE